MADPGNPWPGLGASASTFATAGLGAGEPTGEDWTREVLRVLFRRGRLLTWFAAGVMAAALATILAAEPQYSVAASLLVKKGVAQVPLSPRDAPVWISDHLGEEDINTEIGILTSPVLIEETLEGVGLYQPPEDGTPAWQRDARAAARELKEAVGRLLVGGRTEQDASPGDAEEDPVKAQARAVSAALSVQAVPKSNLVSVELVWPDAVWAERYLTALVEGYQRLRSELYQPPGAAQFFARQTESAARELARAEAGLRTYLAETGITLIEGEGGGDALEAEKRAALEAQRRIERERDANAAEAGALDSELAEIGAQILAESRRVGADLDRRLGTRLEQELEKADRESRELREQLRGLEQSREEVKERLTKIRALEDKLRGLLLRDNGGGGGSKAVRAEVDRLYAELARLGQLKRYDLNTGHDTGLDQALEQRIIETRASLAGLAERQRAVAAELGVLTPRAGAGLEAGSEAGPDVASDAPAAAGADPGAPAGPGAESAADTAAVWAAVTRTQAHLARAGEILEVPNHGELAPVFKSLVQRRVEAESRRAGVAARAEVLDRQHDSASETLALLNQRAGRVRALRRELAREEDAYERYREKSDIAAISAAMSQEQLVNTSLAQPPVADPDPVGPGRLTLLILASVLAVGGGTLLALLFESLDQSLATGHQLERRLGLPLLASVAEGDTDGPLEIGLLGPGRGPRSLPGPPLLLASDGGAGAATTA